MSFGDSICHLRTIQGGVETGPGHVVSARRRRRNEDQRNADRLIVAKHPRTYGVGDPVVDNRTGKTRGRTGRVVGIASLREDGKTKPFYRIDFGRYELHLTADEIEPDISSTKR
ncbi:hypothetical protein WHI96_02815 [Pseudonocardia tropica]|uniref:Uncharacterized protein n=1 Tax=Pseudonocardia tropica TaxID=681289 RepID=A0ABV1JRD8_9PSEU